jgi:hypothetical protein
MKFIIILLLAQDPLYFPFDNTIDCHDQGTEIMEAIATYHGPGPKQGWYTKEGKLVYGFYCE